MSCRFANDYLGDRALLFWPVFLDRLQDRALLHLTPRFKSTYRIINDPLRKTTKR